MGIKSMLRPAIQFSKKIGLLKAASLGFFFAAKPFSHKIIRLNSADARKTLEDYSPFPQNSTSTADNKLIQPYEYDLQVIIPAYNVEKYLQECVESVLNQETEYSYHVIIVDDGSTDKTGEIADLFADNPKCTVIHQKNQGFSGARNTGIKNIKAKYLMFIDSDDKLMPGAIQALMAAAFENDADIVEGGHNTLFGNTLKNGKQYNKKEFLKAEGNFIGQAWAKVFKSEFFTKIRFPEGLWFEDSIMSFLIYPIAQRTMAIHELVYTYRLNPSSITQIAGGKKKSIDTYWITELLMKERSDLNLPVDEVYYKKIMRQIILNYNRTQRQPLEIQQCIFELTSELFEKYFKDEYKYKEYFDLERAFRKRDFGLYRLYCLIYFRI